VKKPDGTPAIRYDNPVFKQMGKGAKQMGVKDIKPKNEHLVNECARRREEAGEKKLS